MQNQSLSIRTWRQRLNGSEFRVMRLNDHVVEYSILDTPERVATYLQPLIEQSIHFRPDVENFGVVFLSTRRHPIGWEIISNGSLDTLLVHPREVFKPAIVINASAICLFHNHPSGDPSPSDADIKITRELIRAGQLLKIDVLDHIILGRPSPDRPLGWTSLRELGYFYAF